MGYLVHAVLTDDIACSTRGKAAGVAFDGQAMVLAVAADVGYRYRRCA